MPTASPDSLQSDKIQSAAAIREAAAAYRADHPGARARSVADGIGVTEAELLASTIGQHDADRVVRLRPPFADILLALEPVGPLMALTRNEHCVHEKTEVYRDGSLSHGDTMGLFVEPGLDLRVFFWSWAHGFYAEHTGVDGRMRRSMQFFDASGTAVHKVYAVEESDHAAFETLAERFAAEDQSPELAVETAEAEKETPLTSDEQAAFVKGWRALTDTHDFFPLLREHGVGRRQALRLAPDDLARRVANDAHRTVLQRAAETGLEIMIFVSNPGMVQIHTGPVERLVESGPWYNVLDPGFNLHLRESGVVESYVVTKPTEDGPVTSLEVMDAKGDLVVQFFGKRKPGREELPAWRELVTSL